MANKKTNQAKAEPVSKKSAQKEPVLTQSAYKFTMAVIILGLIAQITMALIVYPTLPELVPSGFTGSAEPYHTVAKSKALMLFPAFEAVILLIAIFSPKDAEGKRVMTTSNAMTFIVLALVFTALQASAFFINRP